MSRSVPCYPRSATGRADLLRNLAIAPRDHLLLDVDASGWFGYVRREEAPRPPASPINAVAAGEQLPATMRRPPLRMPFVHAIVQRRAHPTPERDVPDRPTTADAVPVEDTDALPREKNRQFGYQVLVPDARLLPALRRQLSATRAGALDLERLTQHVANGTLPRRLPRQRRQRWYSDLVVVLDFSRHLWPFFKDMHRLAERLMRQHGRAGLSLRIVADGPLGTWSDWLEHYHRRSTDEPAERRWEMPPPGTPVLIIGDLGLLPGAESAQRRRDWSKFIADLKGAQMRPMALVPLGARQLDRPATRALPILRWSPDAPARPVHVHAAATAEPDGLDDLLAMAAATRRIDPPLLRTLRRLNPRAPLDAGLEGAFWAHADVEAGPWASVRAGAREHHLRRFEALAPALQAAAADLRRQHHAHLSPILEHEEILLWAAHADQAVVESPAVTAQRDDAHKFMLGLVAHLTRPDGTPGSRWLTAAEGILRRADATMAARQPDLLYSLLASVVRLRGDQPTLPGWAQDARRLAEALGETGPAASAWLVRDADRGVLLVQASPAGPRQSALGEPVAVDAGISVTVGCDAAVWRSIASLPLELMDMRQDAPVLIETARESIVVAAIRRPKGAAGWECDRSELEVRSAALAGREMRWSGDALRFVPSSPTPEALGAWMLEADGRPHPGIEGMLLFGIDAPFGVHADLAVAGAHGSAIQRFRWIEPGTFRMGSSEDEAERDMGEGPRHVVTLTRGFWLADTACTQALWRAVTGGANPSHFADDEQLPVEQVSWDDVQRFLRALEGLLPGCNADLPTEAEWEYACRAGSETPFSFGVQITPERVNYDGSRPYAGGEEGLYRGQTVPVKSLPPNAWGLYEMHGNVQEWCADGLRSYDGEPHVDPVGVFAEVGDLALRQLRELSGDRFLRAVRGGSWLGGACRARSANRSAQFRHSGRSGRDVGSQGFRLCLRSVRRPSSADDAGPFRRPRVGTRMGY